MELGWDQLADDQMTALEADGPALVLDAVRRVFGRLEADPFDPRLRTRQFSSPEYTHVRATPADVDDWFVLWALREEGTWILVIAVQPFSG